MLIKASASNAASHRHSGVATRRTLSGMGSTSAGSWLILASLSISRFCGYLASKKTPVLTEVAVGMPLCQRIALVKKLATRRLDEQRKKEALELWERVQVLSELRNAVCHNPYMFGWTAGKEEGDPDVFFTAEIKKAIQGKRSSAMPNLKKITAGIEESGRIGN